MQQLSVLRVKNIHNVFLNYKIRYEVFCVEKNWEKSKFGIEFDKYDESAEHYLIYNGEDLIGCFRLLDEFSQIKDLFYDSEQSEISPLNCGEILPLDFVEISRLCIIKEKRSVSNALGIIRLVFNEAHLNRRNVAVIGRPIFSKAFEATSIKVRKISPRLKQFHGSSVFCNW